MAPFEGSSPGAQLLIFTGIALISFCLSLILLVLMQSAGFINLSLIQDPANYVNDSVIKDSRNVQMIQDVFAFIIPSILFSFLVSRNSVSESLQINKMGKMQMLIAGAAAIIASVPLINFLGELNQLIPLPHFLQQMEQQGDAIEQAFESHHTLYDLFSNLFVMALLAAFSEELFFRAGLQKILIKMTKNIHVGIWITAAVFSAIHFQFSGFFPRMLLGVFLGYLFVWSGSLWINVFAHFMFNGSQIFVSYLQSTKGTSNVVDNTFSETPGYGYVMVSAILVVFLLVVIYKLREKDMVIDDITHTL
jgi:hypothetical protein